MKRILHFDAAGAIVFIYNDDLRFLMDEGGVAIKRASNVEPTPDSRWDVDFFPLGLDTHLGPYDSRQAALNEEARYLETIL